MALKGRAQKLVALSILATSITVQANIEQADSVAGEYIVRLKQNNKTQFSAQNLKVLSAKLGAFVKSTIPSQNIIVVKRAVFENRESAIKNMSLNSFVEFVEPNYIYKLQNWSNDSEMSLLWGLKNIGQKAPKDGNGKGDQVGIAGFDVKAEQAWNITTGSKDLVVAVIDTGIDYNHPDLKENLWTNQAEANGKAGEDDDNNGVVDDIYGYNAFANNGNPIDDQGHGSHCAGTIGAKADNQIGVAGVNWQTSMMAVKIFNKDGSTNSEAILRGIGYATKMGAKVMSNSWGGGPFSQALLDAIKETEKAGALFIAAAGNSSNDNDARPNYPSSYNVANIISVAAIDNRGAMAKFSSFGKRSVHIGAPGVNILSTTGGSYKTFSGTSMATPHVSGVVALIWGHEPNLTAAEVKQRVLATANRIDSMKGRTSTGGIVDAFAALTNTFPAPDMEDPANWAAQEANYSSPSPYLKNSNDIYEVNFAVEGKEISEMSLYFEKFDTEVKYDFIQIFNSAGVMIQELSGTLNETFSIPIKGNYAKLVFKSDASLEKTGWKISKIAYRAVAKAPPVEQPPVQTPPVEQPPVENPPTK